MLTPEGVKLAVLNTQIFDSLNFLFDFLFNAQLKQAGSVCRPSAGDCDLTEYCTGASQFCPDDSFQMNGTPCYNQAEGYCHDGQCPTHQQHCWRLFGPGTPCTPSTAT